MTLTVNEILERVHDRYTDVYELAEALGVEVDELEDDLPDLETFIKYNKALIKRNVEVLDIC